MNFFSGLFLTFFLASILLMLGFFLSLKASLDRETSSPFECGFTPKFSARLPFSVRFFLVALVFLIFDVELVLLFPVIPAIKSMFLININFIFFYVILILLAGLYHEIFQGSLAWAV